MLLKRLHVGRVARALIASALLAVTSGVASGQGPKTIRVDQVLGLDDDAPYIFHRPTDLSFAADGSAFVLNEGSGEVMHVDDDWELVGRFGGLGESPGRYTRPNGLVLVGSEVWVLSPWRFTVFSSAGKYVRTVRLEEQFFTPRVIAGKIAATSRDGAQVGVVLDTDGRVAAEFGPVCGGSSGSLESILECSNWLVLPSPTHAFALVDKYAGQAYLIEAHDAATEPIDLGLGTGWTDESRMKFKSAATDVTFDGAQGYLALSFSEDGTMEWVHRYDAAFRRVETRELPEGVRGSEIEAAGPDGFCLVSGASSAVYVCSWVDR